MKEQARKRKRWLLCEAAAKLWWVFHIWTLRSGPGLGNKLPTSVWNEPGSYGQAGMLLLLNSVYGIICDRISFFYFMLHGAFSYPRSREVS